MSSSVGIVFMRGVRRTGLWGEGIVRFVGGILSFELYFFCFF